MEVRYLVSGVHPVCEDQDAFLGVERVQTDVHRTAAPELVARFPNARAVIIQTDTEHGVVFRDVHETPNTGNKNDILSLVK